MSKAKFYYQNPDAPEPNQPRHMGVSVFIEKDDKLLLECRSDSGRWCMIGGALEMTESVQDAVLREVKEETGLDVMGYRLFGIFSDPSRIIEYPDGNIIRSITVAFRAEIDPNQEMQISDESLELRYFSKAELRTLDIVETHRHIVDRWLEDPNQIALW